MNLITGVAGFIGSNIAKELLSRNEKVIGIDCFKEYGSYSRAVKENNIKDFKDHDNFTLIEGNLLTYNLRMIFEQFDINYVYHHSAKAGVRSSWGKTFESYSRNNILATQRLLEVVKE